MDVGGDRVVTHLFASLNPGYVGWRWAVTVTRAARAKAVTVSESELLPGPDALLAPDWVPWTERVRPGDLKAGDLMPARSDDERLVPVVVIAGETGLLDWDDSDAWRLRESAWAGPAAETDEAADGVPAGAAGGGPADATASVPAEAAEVGESQAATDAEQRGAEQPGAEQPGKVPTGAGQPGEAQTGGVPTEAGQPEAGQPGTGPAHGDAGTPGQAPAQAAQPRAGSRGRSRRRSGPSSARVQPVGMLRPARVLSAVGRDDAAGRWYSGEQGPKSALASTAPATCLTCGFMVRLGGPLGRVFGVCANEYAPDDGKVVSVDHGCGAHSEGGVGAGSVGQDTANPAVDELGYDMLTAGATLPDSVLETIDHELL